jgi:hypothetical protein
MLHHVLARHFALHHIHMLGRLTLRNKSMAQSIRTQDIAPLPSVLLLTLRDQINRVDPFTASQGTSTVSYIWFYRTSTPKHRG